MLEVFYLLLGLVLGYVYLVGWFFAYTHARILKEKDLDFHNWIIVYPLYVFLSVGALCDILFNWTYGTVAFREFPKEFFFTSRIKRWCKYANEETKISKKTSNRFELALSWKKRINNIEPGHI